MKIFVSGLVNYEVTLKVEGFPVHYRPVQYPFFGIEGSVSGVGYNIAKALQALGNEVRLAAMAGHDEAGRLIRDTLATNSISMDYLWQGLHQTPQSVILYDHFGERAIYTDLKDIQEKSYPPELFEEAIKGCRLAALCNINFSRPYLARAKALGIPIATDVHAISAIDHAYDQDFMRAADVLFMSDVRLPYSSEAWLGQVLERFPCRVAVVTMGARGALMAVRGEEGFFHVPAVTTRAIASTVGAGDAMFAAFCHVYAKTGNPHEALAKATVFASYKIGEVGGAKGFLDEEALERLWNEKWPELHGLSRR